MARNGAHRISTMSENVSPEAEETCAMRSARRSNFLFTPWDQDIVRLFGWGALERFYKNLNIAHEAGVRYDHHVSQVPWDDMSLRMSIGAGLDLTPLFHFWGIHPVDPEEFIRF